MASLPAWALLDRFVFRRDDASFPSSDPTTATSTNSRGDAISLSFRIAAPPQPSALYLQWLAGTGECDWLSLVAAHRDAVLLQMAYPIPVAGDITHMMFDYFLYRPTPTPAGAAPSLQLLPPLGGTIAEIEARVEAEGFRLTNQRLRRLDCLDLGLLLRAPTRADDDDLEIAVAELQISRSPGGPELHVLRPGRSTRWEVKRLPPIVAVSGKAMDLETLLWEWEADRVIPFGDCLCWVDYCIGGILVCNVFDEMPQLMYLEFPAKLPGLDRFFHGSTFSDVYQTLGVTEEGVMKFACVVRGDGLDEFFVPASGFTATSWELVVGGEDEMSWEVEAVVKSDELWALDSFAQLPRAPLEFPLFSIDEPGIMYFILRQKGRAKKEYSYHKTWLVSIDVRDKTLKSSFPYIEEEEKDERTPEMAEFVTCKYWYLESFLQAEFTRFLNLHVPSVCKQGQDNLDLHLASE